MLNNIAEAVEAALSGNNEGFTYLYNTTYKNKYYTALKYMKNENDAADVLQDAYTKAFQNLSMLQDHSKFEGWLGMIVANTAKNYLKKKNPVLFSEMDQESGEGEEVQYQDLLIEERRDFNPEEHYSKEEASQLVEELLSALPEEQKICMIMFYLEGQSVEEIATALECNKNTVLSRLNYGRKKIKAKGEELEKKGYKLYSVSPVALLVLLLSAERNNLVVSGTVCAAAGASAGAATGDAAGEMAGERTTCETVGSSQPGTQASGMDGAPHTGKVSDIKVGETLDSVGKAKKGFLGTTAGKIVAAVAGLAIVGGITTAIILGTGKKEDKDKTGTEYQANNGSTELTTGSVDNTEVDTNNTSDITASTENTSETTEATTEVTKDESEILREYLDKTLVPEYGVYDPSQIYLSESVAAEAPTIYSFEYDEESGELIRMQTDVYDLDGFLRDYSYDYSGIYYAMIDDYNGDDKPELLIIRGTGVHKIDSVGYEANQYIAALYHVEDDKAVLTAETPLYFNENGIDGKERYNIDNIYSMTIDGQKCLMFAFWNPHSDVSQNDYAAIISLKDLTYVSYLHGTLVQEANNVIYSSYKETIFSDGSTKEYRADYREVDGKWETDLGFGSMNDEYLTERGYMNDSTELIFTMCMATDISREYIFLKDGASDDGITTEEVNGNNDMTADDVIAALANQSIFYHGDNRYEDHIIVFDHENMNCTFTHGDHEMYTGEENGEATGSISNIKRIDDNSFSFSITDAKDKYSANIVEETVEDPNIEGGSYIYRHVYEEIAGNVNGEYIIYLPGTPVEDLPQDIFIGDSPAMTECHYYDENSKVTVNYIIYKVGESFAYYAH